MTATLSAITSSPDCPGAAPFNQHAAAYDAWFDTPAGVAMFNMEVEAIRDLLNGTDRPWLEVGVGTGRFAHALGVDEGIDPSPPALKLAEARGLRVRLGQAEALPYSDQHYGVVIMITTLCFLSDVAAALKECRRVLQNKGHLIIGLVPANSRWGRLYAREGAAGHPFYSYARFHTVKDLIRLATTAGFKMDRANSALLDAPDTATLSFQQPRPGAHHDAGFVALRFACQSAETLR